MKRIGTAILLLTASHIAGAITTVGSPACSKWLVERKAGGWANLMNEAWLLGFLSGQSANADIDVLRDPDPKLLKVRIDKYCQEHPQDSVYKAGVALFKELEDR